MKKLKLILNEKNSCKIKLNLIVDHKDRHTGKDINEDIDRPKIKASIGIDKPRIKDRIGKDISKDIDRPRSQDSIGIDRPRIKDTHINRHLNKPKTQDTHISQPKTQDKHIGQPKTEPILNSPKKEPFSPYLSLICKGLVSNTQEERDDALSYMKHLLIEKENDLTLEQTSQLWKGVFYYIWMSNTQLVLKELSFEIVSIIYEIIIINRENGMIHFNALLEMLSREWLKIDKHRLDKYYSIIKELIKLILKELINDEFGFDILNSIDSIIFSNKSLPDLKDFFIESWKKGIMVSKINNKKALYSRFK
eukprot:GHVP01005342.1.p1 GENE.GHVP01005342.1~~GHVP01005342.1.p1  ORF type:complete len:307 (+),score=33.76 GHVP01005342.1:128-1048(+)